jgi:hypothetical protein
MNHTAVLYEGSVVYLVRINLPPPQRVEFKIAGHETILTAGLQYFLDLNVGDYVYAACRIESNDRATVLDMIRCQHNETISEADKRAMLDRLGATIAPPTETNGPGPATTL